MSYSGCFLCDDSICDESCMYRFEELAAGEVYVLP